MAGLSTNAVRVLAALRDAGATSAESALTDDRLAELARLPAREIIDAAGELLEHGYLVLAGGRGRWLGTPAEAREYVESLGRRAKRIFRRRQAVQLAIERNRQQQGTLFGDRV